MSAYAGSWHLLGVDGDPWPGDVDAVERAVTHYDTVAQSIHDQVARLRTIAAGDNQLVGEYQPALKGSSDDLADYLERAEGRFDTVSSELRRWKPELDHGQRTSRSMVDEAEGYQKTIDANPAPTSPVDPDDQQAVDDAHDAATRRGAAGDHLSALVTRFRTLLDSVNKTASSVAGNIRDASHDDLKNHRFDGLRKWIHDHADLLKLIADVLTWIATALVIAALIFTGVGLLMVLAMAATAAALLIHSVLALNGDGSWVDVALDAFALATFGVGRAISSTARLSLAIRGGLESFETVSTAARTALAESSGIAKLVTFATRSNPVFRTIEGLSSGLAKFAEIANDTKLIDEPLVKAIEEMTERVGPGKLLDLSKSLMDFKAKLDGIGLVVDLGFKGLNDAFGQYPGLKPWVDWKEAHTVHGLLPG